MADIAVVIPTLDEATTIAGCLSELESAEGVEVVVVDGGSSDGTCEIVTSRRVRLIRASRGRGPQLNAGARATRADLLLFLHADCRLPGGWREAVEETLARADVSLVCFRLHTGPSVGAAASRARRWWLRALDLRSRLPLLPYGDQGFAVRRTVFEDLGGFEEIPLMEDLAFAAACRRAGRIVRLPLVVRTTARRFEARPVRARIMTLAFPLLFRVGVAPRRLARWYGSVR